VTIALLPFWFKFREMLIADDKQKRDDFFSQNEWRRAVFEATQRILERTFSDDLSEDEIKEYGRRGIGRVRAASGHVPHPALAEAWRAAR